MTYRPWTLSDSEKLQELIISGKDLSTIKETLDRSGYSIKKQIEKLEEEAKISTCSKTKLNTSFKTAKTPQTVRRTNIEKAAIDFLDLRTNTVNCTKVWDSILEFQEVLDSKRLEQTEASIKINTNKWIGIAMIGDLHIGNMATDYKTMLEHRDLIANTDDLYVVLNGDYCDNYIPSSHAAGMFEALFPPAVQKYLAKDYIETIKNKVLALVCGCHDLWSMKASDFDITEYLAKHGEAVYLGPGGTLYLTVGKQKYKIMMRHKYRFNSGDNPTSTVKKMFEKMGGFDIGVVSHHHTASMEECVKEGLDGALKRIFLRAGTYKLHDRFGKQLGMVEGHISVPVVLLNPATRDIRGFQNIYEGVEYLAYLNSGHKSLDRKVYRKK